MSSASSTVPPVIAAVTVPPPVATPPVREVVQPEDYPKLQKRWEATQMLMRTDTSPERREEATRYIMAENGYSPEQIESYVQTKRQPPAHEEAPERSEGGTDDPVVREVVSQGDDLRKMKADRIREKVETHLERALDLKGDAGVLLGELQKKGLSEDRLAKSRETLRKWILREALDALTMRKARSAGKELDLGWIPEELAAAGKRVVDEYRAGIPESAAIGVQGETDSGEEEFLKTKPVPKPKYEKGMDLGGAQSSLRSWIADTLSRDAMKADDDGGTRA